jgi:hypothetical protein
MQRRPARAQPLVGSGALATRVRRRTRWSDRQISYLCAPSQPGILRNVLPHTVLEIVKIDVAARSLTEELTIAAF